MWGVLLFTSLGLARPYVPVPMHQQCIAYAPGESRPKPADWEIINESGASVALRYARHNETYRVYIVHPPTGQVLPALPDGWRCQGIFKQGDRQLPNGVPHRFLAAPFLGVSADGRIAYEEDRTASAGCRPGQLGPANACYWRLNNEPFR